MISIELDKFTLKSLEEKPKLFRAAISKGFRNAMFWIEGKSKQTFGGTGQIKAKTGHLRRSIQTKVTENQSELIGVIGSNLVYAPVHEYGATIKAKNVPYLVFNVGGKWVRKRSVTIPARPFIGPVVKLGIDEVKRQIDIEVMKAEGLHQ